METAWSLFQVQQHQSNFPTSGVTGLTIGTTATLRTISNAACGSTSSDMTITTVSEKAVYPIVHLRLVMDIKTNYINEVIL
jgi:hypothetical protein